MMPEYVHRMPEYVHREKTCLELSRKQSVKKVKIDGPWPKNRWKKWVDLCVSPPTTPRGGVQPHRTPDRPENLEKS